MFSAERIGVKLARSCRQADRGSVGVAKPYLTLTSASTILMHDLYVSNFDWISFKLATNLLQRCLNSSYSLHAAEVRAN